MYLDYFGLGCRPFELSPDSRFLYPSDQHARAIANIRFALLSRDSFVIITGEIGVGKTTVLNKVLAELDTNILVARLTHTTLSPVELMQALLAEFGLRDFGRKKVKMINALRHFLTTESEAGRQVVIMIDEAQNLGRDVLEELRLISCIESETRKIVQVVLMGQPQLTELIDSPGLEQLRQRTRLRQHIRPLDEAETCGYMRHRIDVAGGRYDALFDEDVAPLIYRYTAGVPRLINTLCDTALTGCFVEERGKVSREMIRRVAEELGWDAATAEPRQPVAAWLLVHRAGKTVARIPVKDTPLSIGRGTGSDLHVNDRYLSRRHAAITFTDGRFYVEDLNSRNGTRLNQSPISRQALASGDSILIGCHQLLFYLEGDMPDELVRTRIAGNGGDSVGAEGLSPDDAPTVRQATGRGKR